VVEFVEASDVAVHCRPRRITLEDLGKFIRRKRLPDPLECFDDLYGVKETGDQRRPAELPGLFGAT
jgi:hypothetical protein